MVVPSPFKTQISASNWRVEVGFSFFTTIPRRSFFRWSLLNEKERHALCPEDI